MTAQLDIAALIEAGHLQRVPGRSTDADAFLDGARERLVSARRLLQEFPDAAFVVSFSAVRLGIIGVLAHHDLALTETCRDRSDQDNDDVLVAAVTELVGADRFPELDELRKAYEEQEYGDTREVREAVSAEAQHWVSVAEAIVRAAAELIGGSAE